MTDSQKVQDSVPLLPAAIYRAIVEALHEGVILYDATGNIRFCNARAQQLLGVTNQQLLGHSDWGLTTVHEDGSDFSLTNRPEHVARDSGKACTNVIMGVYRPDETLLWLAINAELLANSPPDYTEDSEGYSSLVVSFLTNISERKYCEDELHDKVLLLSALFESAHLGIAIIDEAGRFLRVNGAYCKFFGYRAEELLGQPFTLLLPASMRTEATQHHADFLAGHVEQHVESWSHRDGQLLPNCITNSRLALPDGRQFCVTFVHATSDKPATTTIGPCIHNETWLRALLTLLPVTVLSLDRQGQLTFAQGRHLDILGLAENSAIGQSLLNASPKLAFIATDVQRALGGEAFSKIIVQSGISFETQYLQLLEDNEWVGTLAVFNDITEHRLLKLRLKNTLHELKLLLSHAPLGLMYVEGQKIVHTNQQCAALLGFTPNELLKTVVERLWRTPQEYSHWQQHIATTAVPTHQWLRKKDGTAVHCQITIESTPQSPRALWLLEDITEQQQQDDVNLQAVLWATTSEAILITDTNLSIQQANPTSVNFTGYSVEELERKSLRDLDTGQQDALFYKRILDAMTQYGRWQGEIWQRHKQGGAYVCEIKLRAYNTEKYLANRYLVVLANRRASNAELLDPLTDLPTRTLFHHTLRKTLALAQRTSRRFALLLIGIDNLEALNNEYGYLVGDLFLHRVGQSLRTTVRDSDTVARYSGDKFCICLDEISQSPDAGLLGQMLLFKMTQPFVLKGHKVQSSASIGIAVYPEDGNNLDILLEFAGVALQRAHQQGGAQCCFYNPKLQES
ncbi:MAG: hypothetical protein BWK79_13230 [Beggiatoa sp. IS2]|nr:MAG: hypothetical protein BWK79_13230 [Beggiatoa sp. IS2]